MKTSRAVTNAIVPALSRNLPSKAVWHPRSAKAIYDSYRSSEASLIQPFDLASTILYGVFGGAGRNMLNAVTCSEGQPELCDGALGEVHGEINGWLSSIGIDSSREGAALCMGLSHLGYTAVEMMRTGRDYMLFSEVRDALKQPLSPEERREMEGLKKLIKMSLIGSSAMSVDLLFYVAASLFVSVKPDAMLAMRILQSFQLFNIGAFTTSMLKGALILRYEHQIAKRDGEETPSFFSYVAGTAGSNCNSAVNAIYLLYRSLSATSPQIAIDRLLGSTAYHPLIFGGLLLFKTMGPGVALAKTVPMFIRNARSVINNIINGSSVDEGGRSISAGMNAMLRSGLCTLSAILFFISEALYYKPIIADISAAAAGIGSVFQLAASWLDFHPIKSFKSFFKYR